MVTVMLAHAGTPFSDPGWLFEVKWDGTRALCHINETVTFVNRRGVDMTYRYPELGAIPGNVTTPCVLDGEIVVLKEGIPSFQDLQKREHVNNLFKINVLSKQIPAVYIVFDVLSVDRKKVTKIPLIERKKMLDNIISESACIMVCPYIEGKGEKYFDAAVKAGFEGVMAKRKDSLYYPGKRSHAWLKIKKTKTADCVIGGYTEGKRARATSFGALLLGVNQPLTYVGKVGTGFTEEMLQNLCTLLTDKETGVNPFCEQIPVKAHFVDPVYVCEVKYQEVTLDRKLRAPVFMRLRHDKAPEECTLTF